MELLDTELINVSVAHLESIYSNLMGNTDNNWRMSIKTIAIMPLLMSGTLWHSNLAPRFLPHQAGWPNLTR